MTKDEILSKLPYGPGFLFVGELLHVDENGVKGTYTFDQGLLFYQSHFKAFPVTPAVILTETMAQIGLVCLGIYLLRGNTIGEGTGLAMTSSCIDFIKPVYPGEQVTVISEKVYFRFDKLSCKVRMENSIGETVCKGTISGMLKANSNE
ncbi:3-hydroxyacyl-ACP dehydratase FabZ family protein [Pedobacter sp. BMA]|uniref:3-hydroxyacyl-ACP dehydratase FabZ family protein n=1 Tax=Pedobacter sp. BMA TaxID=1663685 RepID=UPI00064A3BC0|nr:hydroxymyristoyl-ACP dehydratase [Pedobacter sp. BMA]KLT64300.1 hydroxymyristoyl-ACP dehydratase [Pedobacter sp. BMA]